MKMLISAETFVQLSFWELTVNIAKNRSESVGVITPELSDLGVDPDG